MNVEGKTGERGMFTPVLPGTKKLLENRLAKVSATLLNMYREGVPWPHDAGGFHLDLRRLIAEERRLQMLLPTIREITPPKSAERVKMGMRVRIKVGENIEEGVIGSAVDVIRPDVEVISTDSPVGKAILGKRPGEKVKLGETEVEIVAVEVWQPENERV